MRPARRFRVLNDASVQVDQRALVRLHIDPDSASPHLSGSAGRPNGNHQHKSDESLCRETLRQFSLRMRVYPLVGRHAEAVCAIQID
jgi:hypothetical protein